jgi:hypothetical protein
MALLYEKHEIFKHVDSLSRLKVTNWNVIVEKNM